MADKNYFRLTSLEDGNEVSIVKKSSPADVTLEYSIDDGSSWIAYTIGTGIYLNTNEFVLFRGDNSTFSQSSLKHYNVTATMTFNASGNIMSLLDKNCELISLSGKNFIFNNLFKSNNKLVDASNLSLPATTLANSCYSNMFKGCTSLTSAPELPATTLASNCYSNMFSGCTSLTSAPELPATTLAKNCYSNMFNNCSNLNIVKVSFIAWDTSNATSNWLANVSSTGTFICPEELDTSTRDYSHIPEGWTIEHPKNNYFRLTSLEDGNEVSIVKNGTPADVTLEYSVDDGSSWIAYTIGTGISLNTNEFVLFRGDNSTFSQNTSNYYNVTATKTFNASGNIMSLLDKSCELISLSGKSFIFNNLFNSNNKLVNTSDLSLPATTLTNYCYAYMFSGCTSLTTAPALPATTLADSCYQRMFYNCSSLTSAPELQAQTLADGCYQGMFANCTSLVSAPALPAQTLASNCYSNMFMNCTSLTAAPELPAKTLVSFCYSSMFQGCSNLLIIKVAFTEWNPSTATSIWLRYASSTGTFICPEELDTSTRDDSHIPEGWTIEHPSQSTSGFKNFSINGQSVKTLFINGKEIYIAEY